MNEGLLTRYEDLVMADACAGYYLAAGVILRAILEESAWLRSFIIGLFGWVGRQECRTQSFLLAMWQVPF